MAGLALILALAAALAPPAEVDVASYAMDVRFDPEAHTVEGEALLEWRSPAREPVGELYFHLYQNAFSNEASTFIREGGLPDEDSPVRPDEWGYTEILSIETEAGEDLLPSLEYVAPDDGNEHDRTVFRVELPRPVRRNGTVRVKIGFRTRFSRYFRRTGYTGGFVHAAHWFPKLAVYEPKGMRGREEGGWNAHQFHRSTEFYANYGSYDVTIEVPEGWVVGASGARVGEPAPGKSSGTRRHRFVVRPVHEFAWTASNRLVEEVRTFSVEEWRDEAEETWLHDEVGVPEEELALRPVEVHLLHPPEHAHLVDRQFRAVFLALLYYGYWYGEYPYETLTVLDPPHWGASAGGMEYPTLITGRGRILSPAERQSPEHVLIHEFGHQFWYGLVGSNEFEEGWLDEGFCTYTSVRVLDHAYGPDRRAERWAEIPVYGTGWGMPAPRVAGWSVPDPPMLHFARELPFLTLPDPVRVPQVHARRKRFLTAPGTDPMTATSYRLYDHNTYRVNSYDRAAETLWSLERHLGAETMLRVVRAYQLRWRYGHPTAEDFFRIAEEVSGQELDWFFDQVVRGTATVDYGVGRVENRAIRIPRGIFLRDGKKELVTERGDFEDEDAEAFESEVYVRRFGTAELPVKVLVEREGEAPVLEEWDGKGGWTVFRYTGAKVVRVEVDPEHVWLIDTDLRNNVWAEESDPRAAARWGGRFLFWVQSLLYFFSSVS